MATSAMHLEVVQDLSSEGFTAALRCFVACRGCPATLCTDNGTNFIGVQRELKEFYDFLKAPKIQDAVDRYCTVQKSKGRRLLLDLRTSEVCGRRQSSR